jgi:YidC/Oxa1 family membrane protein insertase
MDDRSVEIRAFLAILLSILFLYLYQAYLIKRQPPPKVEEKENPELVETRGVPFISSGEEMEVETEKFYLRFSGDGSLSSLRLKEYKVRVDDENLRVELIKAQTPPYPLSLFIYSEGNTQPTVPEMKGIKEGKEVIFRGNAGKVEVYKIYNFEDEYSFEFSVTFKNPSQEPQKLSAEILWSSLHLYASRIYNESFKGYVNGKVISKKKVKSPETIGEAEWIAHDMKYFLGGLIPISPPFMKVYVYPFMEKDIISFKTPIMVLPAGGEEKIDFLVYCGPKIENNLKSLKKGLEKAIDFGWFEFLAKPILYMLKFFYRFIPNYGFVIILIVIIVKILFFPLTRMQYRAMKKMKDIQPLIETAKKRYADDKEKLQREILNIYRSYKVNPLSGCLPLLIQFPVFIALYQVLMNAIELRHAPFIFWINDLSSPDSIGSIGIGGFQISIRILPLLLGITTYIQQKISPQTGGEGEEATKWMMKIMPIFLTILFWAFPSGLVLYWCSNNIISIIEGIVMKVLAKRK